MVTLTENMLSIEDVADLLRVNYATVVKYRKQGVRVGGSVIKLQFVQFGRIFRTSRDNVLEFINLLNPGAVHPVQPAMPNIYDQQSAWQLEHVHGVS